MFNEILKVENKEEDEKKIPSVIILPFIITLFASGRILYLRPESKSPNTQLIREPRDLDPYLRMGREIFFFCSLREQACTSGAE